MSGAERERLARDIVNAIELDILDRGGIGNELEQVDDDIREEIRDAWQEIVLGKLNESGA